MFPNVNTGNALGNPYKIFTTLFIRTLSQYLTKTTADEKKMKFFAFLFFSMVAGNFGFSNEYVNKFGKIESLDSLLKGSGVKLPFKRSKDPGSQGAGFRFSCFYQDRIIL